MRVGVEATVDHHHVQHDVSTDCGDGRGIDACGAEISGAARRNASNIVHHE